jgi:hypothetical protein
MQGPDTDAQDQPPPFTQIRLATHGRSIQMGQKQTSGRVGMMSALPPIVLQKSFCTGGQNFRGLQARFSCKDLRDLIASR